MSLGKTYLAIVGGLLLVLGVMILVPLGCCMFSGAMVGSGPPAAPPAMSPPVVPIAPGTPTGAPTRPANPTSAAYSVYREVPYEDGVKAQVEARLVAPPTLSEGDIRAALLDYYEHARARRGWDIHRSTTHVFAYLHHSPESAAAGESGWFAMLSRMGRGQPRISVNSDRLALLREESTMRFGLSEDERRRLFVELVAAEREGSEFAQRRYPSDLARAAEVAEQRHTQGRERLARRHQLTVEQVQEIGREGVRLGWVMD